MNMIRKSIISLGLVLLATPVISGQDLSQVSEICPRDKLCLQFRSRSVRTRGRQL